MKYTVCIINILFRYTFLAFDVFTSKAIVIPRFFKNLVIDTLNVTNPNYRLLVSVLSSMPSKLSEKCFIFGATHLYSLGDLCCLKLLLNSSHHPTIYSYTKYIHNISKCDPLILLFVCGLSIKLSFPIE